MTFGGTPTTGILYSTDAGAGAHFCTASVVHSPAGDVAVTAAHCVYSDGPKSGMSFAPGYHDGQSPYGAWPVTGVLVSQAWKDSNDPDHDVAFLLLGKSPSGASVESVTGADQIAFNPGYSDAVTVPAYPDGASSPITCTNSTSRFTATQLEWDCAGYPDGTSGAPFLNDVAPGTGRGTVIGVIGGYEQGGESPDVSYSCYFGADAQALYQSAAAAG